MRQALLTQSSQHGGARTARAPNWGIWAIPMMNWPWRQQATKPRREVETYRTLAWKRTRLSQPQRFCSSSTECSPQLSAPRWQVAFTIMKWLCLTHTSALLLEGGVPRGGLEPPTKIVAFSSLKRSWEAYALTKS